MTIDKLFEKAGLSGKKPEDLFGLRVLVENANGKSSGITISEFDIETEISSQPIVLNPEANNKITLLFYINEPNNPYRWHNNNGEIKKITFLNPLQELENL